MNVRNIYNEEALKNVVALHTQAMIKDVFAARKEGGGAEVAATIFASVRVGLLVAREIAEAADANIRALSDHVEFLRTRIATLESKGQASALEVTTTEFERDERGNVVSVRRKTTG